MSELDLSEWIEMCLHKIYTGPHAEEFIDGVREYEERIRKLEAKLAKAVEFIEDLTGCEWPYCEDAKRVLTELKGQDNE